MARPPNSTCDVPAGASRPASQQDGRAGRERRGWAWPAAATSWLVRLGDAGEVVAVPPVTPVPLTRSPGIMGVANIRGNLYSVDRLRARFLGARATARRARAPAPVRPARGRPQERRHRRRARAGTAQPRRARCRAGSARRVVCAALDGRRRPLVAGDRPVATRAGRHVPAHRNLKRGAALRATIRPGGSMAFKMPALFGAKPPSAPSDDLDMPTTQVKMAAAERGRLRPAARPCRSWSSCAARRRRSRCRAASG